jgi:peptidoglycan-N-acetylglucosamine deacetylase
MRPPDNAYRWRPAPLVWLALASLPAAAAAVAIRPGWWPWALAAVAACFLLLTAAVFLPRAQLLGLNLTRLPAASARRNLISLTFDDGPDPEITPRVLDLLERHRVKASFFCVGKKAAAHPEIAQEIVRRGHSVENHSLRHSVAFALYGIFRLRREVESAQAVLGGITGRAPRFFRAPAGLRSPLLDPVLARCGLRYVSWTRRGLDGLDRDPARVLQRLTTALAAGDILLLHDSRPVVLAMLPQLLERIERAGLTPVTLPAALGDGPPV